jgi:hypothetical protein
MLDLCFGSIASSLRLLSLSLFSSFSFSFFFFFFFIFFLLALPPAKVFPFNFSMPARPNIPSLALRGYDGRTQRGFLKKKGKKKKKKKEKKKTVLELALAVSP